MSLSRKLGHVFVAIADFRNALDKLQGNKGLVISRERRISLKSPGYWKR